MGQDVNPPESDTGQQVQKLVVDGLLCCIAKALSREASLPELISIVERESNDVEVKSSWVKLFDHYHEAYDAGQKKFIKDINRQTTKNRIEDIVNQLNKADKRCDLNFLVMPWNYSIIDLKTDSEKLTDILAAEKAKDHETKFEAFERKMDRKHSELCTSLQNIMQEFIASQARPAPSASFASVAAQPAGVGAQVSAGGGLQPHARVLQQHQRGRSPSVKRQRADDGSSVTTVSENDATKKPSKSKAVVGTSDSNKAGRKMKSPPADIFVWGVHPDTTIEDIVNDLADSNIIVKETDIEKKSRDEAYLCSYRISVPASDLQKALDPSIWPLRVKVREFIHYARKSPKSKSDQSTGDSDGGGSIKAHGNVDLQSVGAGGHAGGSARPKTVNLQVPLSNVPMRNMFELLSQLGCQTL